jgi:hypothetical protein
MRLIVRVGHPFAPSVTARFKNDKDRDTHLEHAGHKAFGKLVGPVFANVLVIDFRVRD